MLYSVQEIETMSAINGEKKNAICNICTRRLVTIAYQRSPRFRLLREPLKLIMRYWAKLCQINLVDYEVRSPSCYDCMRFYKNALKNNSTFFRLLNKMVNPLFDAILERIVSKEEVDKAKAHARAAMAGEILPCDSDKYISDPRWRRI